MDTNVAGRFFRVGAQPSGVLDLPDLLLREMQRPRSERERNVAGQKQTEAGAVVLLRLEHCEVDGDFVDGQFCRKQTRNIPPQAGPDGLTPIALPDGQGLGHLAAFRYHRPTRTILLQTNGHCASPMRIAAYVAMINPAAIFTFSPVMRQDALDRLRDKKVRSFTVGFASPENLEALDDKNLASVRGARMLAEAYNGLDLTITVGVGRKRKRFLDFDVINKEVRTLLGAGLDLKTLEISGTEDEDGPQIDFLEEHLKCKDVLDLPDGQPERNYEIRKAFLKSEFASRLGYLVKQFGPKPDGNARR